MDILELLQNLFCNNFKELISTYYAPIIYFRFNYDKEANLNKERKNI